MISSVGPGHRVRRWAVALVLTMLAVAAGVVAVIEPYAQPSPASEAARLRGFLEIEPGMTVAEIGAGDGRLAAELARAIAPGGRVLASELDPALVERIRGRARAVGAGNLTAIQAGVSATNLPDGGCDAIYMRRVYHDLADPSAIVRGLTRALGPRGRVAVIDFRPSFVGNLLMPARPNRHGHGITPEALTREMRAAGFVPAVEPRPWAGNMFAAVFRPGAAPAASGR